MGHRKETDYEVTEVEEDVWTCDFCEREVVDEDDIHVFAIDPKVKYDSERIDDNLFWLNRSKGQEKIKECVEIDTLMDGHICDKCIRDADLSTGKRARGVVLSCLRKLRLR